MKHHYKYIVFLFLLFSIEIYAQLDDYKYRIKLTGINDNWHTLILPDHIYSKLNEDLSDLRIYGLTEEGEIIEAPYILNENTPAIETEYIYTNTINQTNIGNRYFYTFENESREKTNSIELSFYNDNFDWKVKLEGSNNQHTWYTILKNTRILALDNGIVDYNYTNLNFTTTQYQYFRLSFNSSIEPELSDVSLLRSTKKKGRLKTYNPKSVKLSEHKEKNTTIIDIELDKKLPVSMVNIEVNDKFDYYRPIEIQKLVDSIETPKGWESYYSDLEETVISSMEKGIYSFNYELANFIQVIVYNHNNHPLDIGTVSISGNIVSLTTRIHEPAEYYLYYGNENDYTPYYDIERFEDEIPNLQTKLILDKEEILIPDEKKEKDNPFITKVWMWSIMALIILIMGAFTLSMLKNSNRAD